VGYSRTVSSNTAVVRRELSYDLAQMGADNVLVSVVAAIFGFTDLAAASADVARILFYIFLLIFLILLVLGLWAPGQRGVLKSGYSVHALRIREAKQGEHDLQRSTNAGVPGAMAQRPGSIHSSFTTSRASNGLPLRHQSRCRFACQALDETVTQALADSAHTVSVNSFLPLPSGWSVTHS
jgi:uncharacterized membrane protein YtjA (UPF0391 family)